MEIMTVDEVAAELKITPESVRRYCQEGRFGRKFGRQWLITREEVNEFQRHRRPPGRPSKEDTH